MLICCRPMCLNCLKIILKIKLNKNNFFLDFRIVPYTALKINYKTSSNWQKGILPKRLKML